MKNSTPPLGNKDYKFFRNDFFYMSPPVATGSATGGLPLVVLSFPCGSQTIRYPGL